MLTFTPSRPTQKHGGNNMSSLRKLAASAKATSSVARAFQAKQRSKLLEERFCQQAARADADVLRKASRESEEGDGVEEDDEGEDLLQADADAEGDGGGPDGAMVARRSLHPAASSSTSEEQQQQLLPGGPRRKKAGLMEAVAEGEVCLGLVLVYVCVLFVHVGARAHT